MTREDINDIIKTLCPNDEDFEKPIISPAYLKKELEALALEQKPCEDCISRADALRVAKNEYLRGWHEALCKALSEKYSIHCEEGNFSVIQEETITGLGLSMNCAVGKDVESYMSTIPPVTPIRPKGQWIFKKTVFDKFGNTVECSSCHKKWKTYDEIRWRKENKFCPKCGSDNREVEE
jgi:hypothetical protein